MLRRLLLLSLLLIVATPSWAAAPSRTYTYTTGNTIDPSQVTTNEDNIFSYLQAGVDTYAAGTVNAAAIADDAVGAAEIAAGAVGASEIASGAVDAGDMATTGTIADDKVFVADSSTAATWRTITNCTGSTSALQYTQSTNSFSCGTISGDVGGTNAARVHRTAGSVTTTSTTGVAFTGATATITTAANPVLVGWIATCSNDTVSSFVTFSVDIDGTNVFGGQDQGLEIHQHATAEPMNCSFVMQTAALTAASHTIALEWAVGAGTGTTVCVTATPCQFWVTELVD